MKQVTTAKGFTRFIPTLEEIEAAESDMTGFCIHCGAEGQVAEPDARKYRCDECNAPAVYGAQELALMGLVA